MVVHPQLAQLVPHTPEATVLTKRLGIRVLLEYRPKKKGLHLEYLQFLLQ